MQMAEPESIFGFHQMLMLLNVPKWLYNSQFILQEIILKFLNSIEKQLNAASVELSMRDYVHSPEPQHQALIHPAHYMYLTAVSSRT